MAFSKAPPFQSHSKRPNKSKTIR